jgi:hypothetical protein
MRGRTVFPVSEANRVRTLLCQVRDADRDQQKLLRDRLRNDLGFYISDFTSSNAGFTAADFDSLVTRGIIKVE